jgi:Spy/CpxP family protein refolding chaperone
MVTKTKIAGLILATAAVLASPMFVYADNGGGDKDSWHQDGGWHHGKDGHMMAKVLGLTEDQVKQLKDIHQKQKEAMKSVFEQIKSNREAFNAEIVKAAPDMNKVNDLQAQFKTIQGQMLDNHLNSLLEVKKVMTPEQFAGFMALKKERELKMHHGRKDGHNHWADKGKDGDKGHEADD